MVNWICLLYTSIGKETFSLKDWKEKPLLIVDGIEKPYSQMEKMNASVIINESTQHNHLDLLFVKNGVQSNGIGKKIWLSLIHI